MALERKTGLLAEILIRFSDGLSHKAPLGAFNGGHVCDATAIVDTDTGEVEPGSYRQSPPRAITADDFGKLVSKDAADFVAGFAALQKERDDLAGALKSAQDDVAHRDSVIESSNQSTDQLKELLVAANLKAQGFMETEMDTRRKFHELDQQFKDHVKAVELDKAAAVKAAVETAIKDAEFDKDSIVKTAVEAAVAAVTSQAESIAVDAVSTKKPTKA